MEKKSLPHRRHTNLFSTIKWSAPKIHTRNIMEIEQIVSCIWHILRNYSFDIFKYTTSVHSWVIKINEKEVTKSREGWVKWTGKIEGEIDCMKEKTLPKIHNCRLCYTMLHDHLDQKTLYLENIFFSEKIRISSEG